jgi:hypothetical protein
MGNFAALFLPSQPDLSSEAQALLGGADHSQLNAARVLLPIKHDFCRWLVQPSAATLPIAWDLNNSIKGIDCVPSAKSYSFP